MKLVKGIALGCLALGVVALAFTPAQACDGAKKTASAEQVSASGCASKAEVKTVSTSSCAAKAASVQTVSADHCAAKSASLTASAKSCGAKSASLTASAGCDPSDCTRLVSGSGCDATHVVYRVALEEGAKDYFDRSEAMKAAGSNSVQFVALGTSYEDEREAQMAMLASLHERLQSFTTIQNVVNGESVACCATAAKMAKKSGSTVEYRVANRTFATKDQAEAYLGKIQAAIAAIQLTDAEGHAVEGCAVSYSKDHANTSFKCGTKKIDDPMQANLTVAQEKFRAILLTDA